MPCLLAALYESGQHLGMQLGTLLGLLVSPVVAQAEEAIVALLAIILDLMCFDLAHGLHEVAARWRAVGNTECTCPYS